MKLLKVQCSFCKNNFYKSLRRVNESQKKHWKLYCSNQCLKKSKNKQQLITCSNPLCKNRFRKLLSKILKTDNNYCSRSCAVSINNVKFPKRFAIKNNCNYCNKEFIGRKKYCSRVCKNKNQTISIQKILNKIKEFYTQKGRIPLKVEFPHERAARNHFGSWNKAINAAGFNPNPVRFSKKYIAKDGHKCDSLSEKIIDDWLFYKKIIHERQIPYNKNSMTADFKVGDTLIEFFGLQGELKTYDRIIKRKQKLWKERNLKVITIYPKDLFPNNKLSEILNFEIKQNTRRPILSIPAKQF